MSDVTTHKVQSVSFKVFNFGRKYPRRYRYVTLRTHPKPLKTTYASRLLPKQGPEAVRKGADGRRTTEDGWTHTHQIFEAPYTISPGGQQTKNTLKKCV